MCLRCFFIPYPQEANLSIFLYIDVIRQPIIYSIFTCKQLCCKAVNIFIWQFYYFSVLLFYLSPFIEKRFFFIQYIETIVFQPSTLPSFFLLSCQVHLLFFSLTEKNTFSEIVVIQNECRSWRRQIYEWMGTAGRKENFLTKTNLIGRKRWYNLKLLDLSISYY